MQKFLEHASRKYYEGDPIISDEEFDSLALKYGTSVGYQVTDAYPHAYRMYSLQKFTPADEAPMDLTGWIKTIKLDGAAVSLTYHKAKLISVLTRGDGIEGKDITHLFRGRDSDEYNMFSDELYQITGEMVASKDIKNSRNYAAGALGLKDQQEYWNRKLTFVPYDVQSPGLQHCKFWTDKLDWLCNLGFHDIRDKELEERFPTDGYVWRVNSLRDYENLGHTSHHPRGSFAVKEEQKPVKTILRKVTWQLGKSGVVSPVGHFDPIEIGGATIQKATLHNKNYIDMLNLELGCIIGVIRSGEIIPRIVGRYDD